MPKIIAEIKKPKMGFGNAVLAAIVPISLLAVAGGFIYTFIHDTFEDTIIAQETVIGNLETRLEQLSTEYNELRYKTKGINELQLWKSDVIEVENERFSLYGGLVYFIVKEKNTKLWEKYKLDDESILFNYHNDIDNEHHESLDVLSDEPFPFEVNGEKFILKFSTFSVGTTHINAEIYNVKPLYVTSEDSSR